MMVLERGAYYKHNVYQCYLAALMFGLPGKFKTCVLGSGQGKTWIIVLLANYLITVKKIKEVVILTTSKLVVD